MSSDNNSTSPTPGAGSSGDDSKKLGLFALIAVVISAMVGGGIYDLPQNMAAGASAGAIIVAWIVTGIGMWFIANTFRILSSARPEMTNGLYTYAEDGFGRLWGFLIAYGYWVCNCFALVAYSILIMTTINYFFPYFQGGNNIPAIIVGSIITWIMYFITLAGAKSTSFLNNIGTVAKLVPVAIFILLLLTIFKLSTFTTDFWGVKDGIALTFSFDNLLPQVKSTMLVTLWLFIGIEGAVVVSGNAKSQTTVRRATLIAFILMVIIYALVSLLGLGVFSQAQIGSMTNPSMGTILQDRFGSWGAIIINIGVIVSVLSSWLVWMIMLAEMPTSAAKDGTFPDYFLKKNEAGANSHSLLITTAVIQVILLFSYFAGNAWNTMISITGVMALPCYLLSTLYLFKIAYKKEYPKDIFASATNAVVTGILGSVYGVWLIYAAGLNYLMIACIVYAIGLPIYVYSIKKKDPNATLFKPYEKVVVVITIVLALAAVIDIVKTMIK